MYLKLILFALINKKSKDKGFTLIELLTVSIIVGILFAVAIPNLIYQVGKARESEAKANLGSIGRSQQVYFFERATFADQISKLDVSISSNGFYNYPNPTDISSSLVKHIATNPTATTQATKNYSIGVYFLSGDFGIILCKSNEVGGTVEAPNTYGDICVGGEEVR